MEKKYYHLYNELPENKPYSGCYIDKDSPWFLVPWGTGEKFDIGFIKTIIKEYGDKPEIADTFDNALPEPIVYFYEIMGAKKKKITLPDYPNASSFLMSRAMYDIVCTSGCRFDTYQSIIRLSETEFKDDYYSLNITESFPALDLSKYELRADGTPKFFLKIILKRLMIPMDRELFILTGSGEEKIVSESLKMKLTDSGITGINFIPIEITEDSVDDPEICTNDMKKREIIPGADKV